MRRVHRDHGPARRRGFLVHGHPGLAVPQGCGLLIGVERERRKGQGPTREAAGLRSFAVVACMGGLAQWLAMPNLVVVGAALVAGLATLAYWRSRDAEPNAEPDPGLPTELALLAIDLIGVVAVRSPALGAACGAGLALLLQRRWQPWLMPMQPSLRWHPCTRRAPCQPTIWPWVAVGGVAMGTWWWLG